MPAAANAILLVDLTKVQLCDLGSQACMRSSATAGVA